MKRVFKIISIVFLFGLLVVIRLFENELFYDPLLNFFKTNHATQQLPELETFRLIGHLAFRFLLNTMVSLAIIWVFFRDKGFMKLSAILYALLFAVLLIVFVILIATSKGDGHMLLFYVRRFLIQPVFLLILLPAFYFQKKRA